LCWSESEPEKHLQAKGCRGTPDGRAVSEASVFRGLLGGFATFFASIFGGIDAQTVRYCRQFRKLFLAVLPPEVGGIAA
jgi:hypothetical protein